MSVTSKKWGEVSGNVVNLYSITEGQTILVVSNYGALIQSLFVPNKLGESQDIVLGFNDLAAYQADTIHMGVIPAIFVNRIRDGAFNLNGKKVQLECQDKPYSQHAGQINKLVWAAEVIENKEGSGVIFSLKVEDGFEGFPGPIYFAVTYFLDKSEFLYIQYHAISDQDTVINLTNHAYFNLGGEDILSHELRINSNAVLKTDENILPTGELSYFKEASPFNFQRSKRIGKEIDQEGFALNIAQGYDVSYVVDQCMPVLVLNPLINKEEQTFFAVEAFSERSGIQLQLYTSQPIVHFYSGNSMDGAMGKN
ncbi:hypothetical protein N8865_02915, partial [Francisellaceae bacterium]|nr:hypothetical protein [Francisellaceae bacterium]